MNNPRRLKDLATQFFSEIAPRGIRDLDRLFEKWKCGLPKKQEVNFGMAMPPSMREQVLRDIGFSDVQHDRTQSRYFGYLNILGRLAEMNIDELLVMSFDSLSKLIKEEGRRLSMTPAEIEELSAILPHWIQKISNKVEVEFSPMNILEMSHEAAKSAQDLSESSVFRGIIGRSEKMQSIFNCIQKISSSDLSILIQGESGTGKELVAHAIHANSKRVNENFIPVNCGALPDSIIESELFGYERGAFTGAVGQKIGYFEIADRGTIFLDEISETSLNTQVKLLRVLQEKKIRRVGGIKPIAVDIRVIAATNRDLPIEVRSGGFRHDLYYRINEMTITLPPLRDRQSDLPLLMDHFLEKFAKENSKPVPQLDAGAKTVLFNYSWPGNIRELENVLKRAVVLADTVISKTHLPQTMIEPQSCHVCERNGAASNGSLDEQLMNAEREIIVRALEDNANNVSVTAKKLQISRRTLQRKMRLLGIFKE